MRKKKQEPTQREDSKKPPDGFLEYWYPSGEQEPSGASVGGHPDAARMWARKDPGRWTRRAFGMTADSAWAVEEYRDQYRDWVDAGRPVRDEFVSVCVPVPELVERMKGIHAMLAAMPKVPTAREERDRLRKLQAQKVALLKAETAKPVKGRTIEDKADEQEEEIKFDQRNYGDVT